MFTKKSITEIVRENYRTADVFKKYGINYCCGGQASLKAACDLQALNYNGVLQELKNAVRVVTLPNSTLFASWRPVFLVEFIINVHHNYVRYIAATLQPMFLTFVDGHKKKYPGMESIMAIFNPLLNALLKEIDLEEAVIFPYLLQQDELTDKENMKRQWLDNQAVHNKLLQDLAAATDNYSYPQNACTNHRVIYQKLKEFHNDFIQHKYLESEVLYKISKPQ